ncbi:MAG: gluconokinase [Verrucomicrobiales bacterium]
MKPFALAFDVGTSSVRAGVYTQTGRLIPASFSQSQHRLHTDSDGTATLEPQELLRSTQQVGRHAIESCGAQSISTVSMSCFWHSLLALNTHGDAITPILTWADTRCSSASAWLREVLDEKATHHRTGCMLRSSFWTAKLAWVRRDQPQWWQDAALWVGPAEWLLSQMFGVPIRQSVAMASGTGLYDSWAGVWDQEILETLELEPDCIASVSDQAMELTQAGVLARAKLYPAIGDGAASNLGSGASGAGRMALNFGTSGAVRLVETNPDRIATGLFRYKIDDRHHLIGGAVSNAGNLHQWLAENLRLPGDAELEGIMSQRIRPVPSLHVLPFLVEERAPTWPTGLPGTILGLKTAHTAVDIYQAAMEAVYQRLARIAGLIRGSRADIEVMVSGGLSQSAIAMQRMADVMQLPLSACEEAEASLRGAAVFALRQSGVQEEPAAVGAAYEPRLSYADEYREQGRALERLETWFLD